MKLLRGLLLFTFALPASAQTIEVKSVILKLIAQVEVSAKEAGELAAIDVKEGQAVEPGMLLARVEDHAVQLLHQQAKLELQIAEIEAKNEADVRAAEQEAKVAEEDLKRARQSKES